MMTLLLCLLIGFQETSQPMFEVVPAEPIYKFEVIKNLEHLYPPLKLDPIPDPIGSRKNQITIFSEVSEEELRKGSRECLPCLLAFQAQEHPEIKKDFDFHFSTDIPSWAEGQPVIYWQSCPTGRSKGKWLSQTGWTNVDNFLLAWDMGERGIVAVKPKAAVVHVVQKSQQPRMPVRQFTWPKITPEAELRWHLENDPNHRISTKGMTYDEMLYEHNKWHTINGPR